MTETAPVLVIRPTTEEDRLAACADPCAYAIRNGAKGPLLVDMANVDPNGIHLIDENGIPAVCIDFGGARL